MLPGPQGVLNRVTPCTSGSPSSHPTGTLTVVCRFEHNLFPIATPSDTVAPLSFSRSLALSCCSAQKYAIIFLPLLQQLRAHKQINTQPARCGKQQSSRVEEGAGGEGVKKETCNATRTHIMDVVDASSSFIIMQNVLPGWHAFSSNSSSRPLSSPFLSLSHCLAISPSLFFSIFLCLSLVLLLPLPLPLLALCRNLNCRNIWFLLLC